MIRWALTSFALALAVAGVWLRPEPEWRFAEPLIPDASLPAAFETVFSYMSPEGTAHAPAILPGTGSDFGLIWFDGIRESHNDVRILGTGVPGEGVQEVLTRHSVSVDLRPGQTVLTLGNTIGDGQGGLLATVVSLGGWAASSIAHLPVDESGTITQARRINVSPLLNRSHLVKSPVVPMVGGGALVPAYFEMGNAYGVAVRVDAGGRVRAQADMRGGFKAIQPMIVSLSDREAVALLRPFEPGARNLLGSWTEDGGQSWSAPRPLDLPNPSAPVAATRLSSGELLMAFNDAPDRADTLSLALSSDGGRTWQRMRVLGESGGGDLRYPMMQVLQDGQIALTYSTGSKSGIVAHVFTERWARGE